MHLPRLQDGRERRRRARESRELHTPPDATILLQPGQPAGEGADSLAIAGIMLAAAELDRLSLKAHERSQRVEKAKHG